MHSYPFRILLAAITLAASLPLIACSAPGSSATESPYGRLNGVLASDAPIVFVPVGVNEQGCTMYTKKPLREGILVDTGIWYRTADDRFVLDASRCAPGHASSGRGD